MKSIIFFTIGILLAHQAKASPTIISNQKDVSFAVMPANESLFCSRYDKDQDGIVDTARVSVVMGKAFSNPTYLSVNYITNEFPDNDGDVCKKIEKIIELSPMNFGAAYITLDSVLMLDRATISEHITLTLGTRGEVFGLDGLEVVDTEIILNEIVSKELSL